MSRQPALLTLSAALLTACGCFILFWMLQRTLVFPAPAALPRREAALAGVPGGSPRTSPAMVIKARGSERVREMAEGLEAAGADPARFAATARALLQDSRNRDDRALWSLLLAHWSLADGPGMIAFVEKDAPAVERHWLRPLAWPAWGAADPDAAFAAGRTLPVRTLEALIKGIAERDARKAAEFALRSPGATGMLRDIAPQLAAQAPELIEELRKRVFYDVAGGPLQEARVEVLAKTDPAAAIEAARRSGRMMHDPVPLAVAQAAARHPVRTAEAVEAMPSSRSKALSVVSLAKSWAARDAEAAVQWVRRTQYGPVRHFALVEAAAAAGGADPAAGLALLEEAGWEAGGDFFDIAKSGSITPSESRNPPSATRTAAEMLRRLSALNGETARRFLQERVPANLRPQVAKEARLNSAPD